MKYYVADSYKNYERIGEPFDKGGRMYTKVKCDCDRCGGSGVYSWGAIINGIPQHAGTCYKCEGAGSLQKEVRLYTEKEYEAMQKARLQRQATAEEKRAARLAEKKAKAFKRWCDFNGFNSDGDTFIVYGNTYPIKDELKAQGYKFSKELKWHGPAAVDVPEDCFVEKANWSDIYEWFEDEGRMHTTEKGEQFLKEIFSKNSEGEYFGEIGERFRNIPVVFEKMGTFEGAYGTSHVYKFDADGAKLTWFTTCIKDLEEGAQYTLTGTVKKHEVYGNVKTTYLSRCIIK